MKGACTVYPQPPLQLLGGCSHHSLAVWFASVNQPYALGVSFKPSLLLIIRVVASNHLSQHAFSISFMIYT